MSAPTKTLRSLLRHLKKHSPSSSLEGGSQEYLKTLYKQEAATSETAKLGEDYLKLLTDITERSRLHNLDKGVEKKLGPKEMTKRSAARSGFSMPDEYDSSKIK